MEQISFFEENNDMGCEDYKRMNSNRIASVLVRKDSSRIIAVASDFWETLTGFVKELCKLNNKTIRKSDFQILSLADYVTKYPDADFSKIVKKQWEGKLML